MHEFRESHFRSQVNAALNTVKHILAVERDPHLAGEVSHTYDDKYLLAEFVTDCAIQALLQTLACLQINQTHLATLRQWSQERSVSLRLQGQETCEFDHKETHEEESKVQHVTEVSNSLLGKTKITNKSVTTITTYFWRFSVTYELVAFPGVMVGEGITLLSRTANYTIRNRVDQNPYPSSRAIPTQDLNILWLLQNLNGALQPAFRIVREAADCHTPRRNRQVEQAFRFFEEYYQWAAKCTAYFQDSLFAVQPHQDLDLTPCQGRSVFNPVLPLFEARSHGTNSSVVLEPDVMQKLLAEHQMNLENSVALLERNLKGCDNLITLEEARILLSLSSGRSVCEMIHDCVNYIEYMLEQQLISAIGKIVQPSDLQEYMEYHNRKLFREAYMPRKLCFAVRRPDHSPEGTLSVINVETTQPVTVFTHRLAKDYPMEFALNAAARVQFTGPRYVHGLLYHRFSQSSPLSVQLSARARQFSSFILVVGNIISGTALNPKHAIIVQNKDDLLIPLLLEEIPTAQAFRDAIESLSPEQQRFAKAFRSMQLESTLFGVCVIQIKPQLEKLLGLPEDSLTKEIELTQDLMTLFIEYQVPSDLLSFEDDGEQDYSSGASRVEQVRAHVAAMQGMIDRCKQAELEEARLKAEMERLRREEEKARLEAEARRRAEEEAARRRAEMEERRMRDQVLCLQSDMMCEMAMPKGSSMFSRKSRKSSAPRAAQEYKSSAPMMSAPPPMMSAAPSLPMPSSQMSRQSAAPQNDLLSFTPSLDIVSRVEALPEVLELPEAPEAPEEPQEVEAEEVDAENKEGAVEAADDSFDLTQIPVRLDKNFGKYDLDAAVHSVIVKAGNEWQRSRAASLLGAPVSSTLNKKLLKEERNVAFDLLDALTRSGGLNVDDAAFHVILAASHAFDQTLMETLVQKNVNPIERIERSMLIIASTLTEEKVVDLIKPDCLERVQQTSPNLFE